LLESFLAVILRILDDISNSAKFGRNGKVSEIFFDLRLLHDGKIANGGNGRLVGLGEEIVSQVKIGVEGLNASGWLEPVLALMHRWENDY
jgi:hypothetical protein